MTFISGLSRSYMGTSSIDQLTHLWENVVMPEKHEELSLFRFEGLRGESRPQWVRIPWKKEVRWLQKPFGWLHGPYLNFYCWHFGALNKLIDHSAFLVLFVMVMMHIQLVALSFFAAWSRSYSLDCMPLGSSRSRQTKFEHPWLHSASYLTSLLRLEDPRELTKVNRHNSSCNSSTELPFSPK